MAGCDLVHLQCHIGPDTLSWARRGAGVVGLDFSPPAIEATFEVGDVLEASTILDRRFDIVYTGIGALCWIDDLHRWARQIGELLVPGGRLYLVEIHPITDIFDKDGLTVEHHYFDHGAPSRDETPGTYADERADPRNNLTCQWTHTLDAVL